MPFDAQVFRLAAVAREKLCREAAKASHDLRALVAHANLLDELLVELSAPRDGKAEHYGFDLIPRQVKEAMTPRPARPIVVTVMEGHERELEDHLESSTHSGSASTLPMLYHDYAESESDSGSDDSDSISDDGDDYETEITSNSPPASPATSVSSAEGDVEPNEDEVALHRTRSGWRLLGNWPSKQQSGRRNTTPVGATTDGVRRMST